MFKNKLFLVSGVLYKVSKANINRFTQIEIKINNKYLKNLLKHSKYKSCIKKENINEIIKADYYNKIVFSKHALGKIYLYEDGEKREEYNDFVDVIEANKDKIDNFMYGFENLDKEDIKPIREEITFFCKKISIINENPYIKCLNSTAKKIALLLKKENLESNHSKNEMALITALYVGTMINSIKRRIIEKKEREKLSLIDYNQELRRLLNRYSFKEQALIEEVKDIQLWSKISGIYILCLDYERGYYVGQTKEGIMERIISHFKKQNSDFDKLHRIEEVKRIYAIKCPKAFLDKIEIDIIAYLNKKFILNCLIGGNNIYTIDNPNYVPDKYMLKADELTNTLKEIVKINNDF